MSNEYFKVYKDKKVYRSLSSKDYIQEVYYSHNFEDLLDDCFKHSETYSDSIKYLRDVLNKDGLKTYRARFAKYKSALKTKAEKKQINVSQRVYDQIKLLMDKMGEGTTYDEVIEMLLDPSEEFISDIKREFKFLSYPALVKALPYDYRKLLNKRLVNVATESFIAGVRSVPVDARKKTKINNNVDECLDEFLTTFKSNLF